MSAASNIKEGSGWAATPPNTRGFKVSGPGCWISVGVAHRLKVETNRPYLPGRCPRQPCRCQRRRSGWVTRRSGGASILGGTGTASRTGRCYKRVTTAFREAEVPLLAPNNAYTSDIVLACVMVTAGSVHLLDSGRHLMGRAIRNDPSRRNGTPPCRASSGLARNGICRLQNGPPTMCVVRVCHGWLARPRFLVPPLKVEDRLEARDVVLMRSLDDETLVRGDGPHSISECHLRVPTARRRRTRNADIQLSCTSRKTRGV
jgi:hypothetical protein